MEGVDGVFQVLCQCPYFTAVEEDTGDVGIEGSHCNLDAIVPVEDVFSVCCRLLWLVFSVC